MKFQVILLFLLAARFTIMGGAADVRYRVVPMEPPQPNTNFLTTIGYTINDNGMVAGMVYRRYETPYPSGSIKGVFTHTTEDGFQEVGDYEGALVQPNRINNRGQFTIVGGRGYETNGGWGYIEHAVRYTPGTGFERLGDLGGDYTRAIGINAHGDVVGQASISLTNLYDFRHAFLYTDQRGMVDLGTFGGTSAAAADINDEGWICGYSVIPGMGNAAWIFHEDEGVNFLGHGSATRINERRSVICDNDFGEPVLIKKDGRVVRLQGNPEAGTAGFAGDLNDYDVVVTEGRYPGTDTYGGIIWTEEEGIRSLNVLIGTNSGWRSLGITYDINNHGQITGEGVYQGRPQAYRLDPIPPKLAIQPSATNLVVSWSPAWPGLVLEATEDLSAPNWQPIATGGTNLLSLSRSEPHRFFRLNLDGIRGLCCAPE